MRTRRKTARCPKCPMATKWWTTSTSWKRWKGKIRAPCKQCEAQILTSGCQIRIRQGCRLRSKTFADSWLHTSIRLSRWMKPKSCWQRRQWIWIQQVRWRPPSRFTRLWLSPGGSAHKVLCKLLMASSNKLALTSKTRRGSILKHLATWYRLSTRSYIRQQRWRMSSLRTQIV